jgi:glycosyltransferase involved in cell wall biosynthesis
VNSSTAAQTITVIIPARNEAHRIADTIRAVANQSTQPLEVLVADDGSSDGTGEEARRAGAQVIGLSGRGNPAAARNAAARSAKGSILVFLDADCVPRNGWLAAHLEGQRQGRPIVGGSLALPPQLSWWARADYYATAYHVHPGRSPGVVPNHPPANLSVQQAVFRGTRGFTEQFPVADGHEELAWLEEARRQGAEIYFEPSAVAEHWNRGGLGNILRRSYRWGYSALEAKANTGASRLAGWYRFPLASILLAYPLALLETVYVAGSWLAAGRLAVIQFSPVILISRLVYATAFIAGGCRWLIRARATPGRPPRWR